MYIESYGKRNNNLPTLIVGGIIILLAFLVTSDRLNIADIYSQSLTSTKAAMIVK